MTNESRKEPFGSPVDGGWGFKSYKSQFWYLIGVINYVERYKWGAYINLKKKKKKNLLRARETWIFTFACLGEIKSNKIEGGQKNDKNKQKVIAS